MCLTIYNFLAKLKDTGNWNKTQKQISDKALHECSVCGKTFPSQLELQNHTVVHSREREHVCSICNKRFRLNYCLKEHVKLHYQVEDCDNTQHECPICYRIFSSTWRRKKHISVVHSNERPYACIKCGSSFARNQHVKKHKKTCQGIYIAPEVSKTVFNKQCMICLRSFKKESTYTEHLSMHECEKGYCKPCNLYLDDVFAYEVHKALKHCELFDCKCCDKSFEGESKLADHLKIDHNKQPQDFVDCVKKYHRCSVCSIEYKDVHYYRAHVRKHFGSFSCEKCGKETRGKTALEKHCESQHGKFYKCLLCEKKFSYSADVRKHVYMSHPTYSPENRSHEHYEVQYKSKNAKEYINKHLTCQDARKEPSEVKRRQFFKACPICLRSFEEKIEYDKHFLLHTTEKGYCASCNLFETDEFACEIHKALKHWEYYKCKCCDKSFEAESALSAHLKEEHNKQPDELEEYKEICYRCPVCADEYKHKNCYQEHLEKHFGTFTCEKCGKDLGNKRDFEKHCEADHGKYYQCLICDEKFNFQLKITEHIYMYHATFSSMNRLYNFYKIEYTLPGEQAKEDVSKKKINQVTRKAPYEWKETCHSIKGIKNNKTCIICLRTFEAESVFSEHLSLHRSKKSNCESCNLSVDDDFDLEIHRALKHCERFNCICCGAVFENVREIYDHLIKHHGKQPSELTDNRVIYYCCPVCKNQSNNWDYYKGHLRKVFGTFTCELCGKELGNKAGLEKHCRSQHGKYFNCLICDENFDIPELIRDHIFCVHQTPYTEIRLHEHYRNQYKCM